ncbi:MAG TPA: hypothetical protein VMW91_07970 [Desulfosporosinus sp.]|nr:hypothetical protein [Desulfosporosinus sp.]
MQVRYDEKRGIYRDCRFCEGLGCLACHGEAEKAYKKAFPNGPEPIATFKLNNPTDMERARKIIGGEALKKAFGHHGGGGVYEIMENLLNSD